MARTRDWWTIHNFGTGFTANGEIDVLSGSGLAVAGATVLRSLGCYEVAMDPADVGDISGLFFGLRVAETASNSDLQAPNVNTFDWLWISTGNFYETRTSSTPRVGSDARINTNRFDATTRRVLEAGETLWYVWRINGSAPAITARQFFRTLVLSPDV